jgi:linoleoyl-CoA desaturase
MLAKKALVLGYSLALPLVVLHQPWILIATGWLVGHMACGLTIAVIFQTTHLHEGTSFIEPDEDGQLPDSFALHILKTTAEFSTENPLVTWIAGGLNLHVTHKRVLVDNVANWPKSEEYRPARRLGRTRAHHERG